MKIASFNVNGLRAAERKGFLDWLKGSKIDIVGIQETKADKEQLSEDILNIDGYTGYFNSSKEKKGYSGTAVYTKFEPKKEEYDLGLNRFDQEGRMVKLTFDNFTLINLYMPQGGRQKERLDFKLQSYDFLIDCIKNKRDLIILGDFNIAHKEIDLARPKENKDSICFTPEERAKIDHLLDSGFIDTFRKFEKEGGYYTWWSYMFSARKRNVGWRVDYVFVSKNLRKKLKKAFILNDVFLSDHCPAGIEIEIIQ